MSKATEWAGKVALQPEFKADGCGAVIAGVNFDGGLALEGSSDLTALEALKFADWIYDTFDEQTQAPEQKTGIAELGEEQPCSGCGLIRTDIGELRLLAETIEPHDQERREFVIHCIQELLDVDLS